MGMRDYFIPYANGTAAFYRYNVNSYIVNPSRIPVLMKKVASADYPKEGKSWEELSPSAKHLIESLLCVDPLSRLSAKEALDHNWLS